MSVAAAIAAAVLAGCGGGSGAAPSREEQIDGVVDRAGKLPAVEPYDNPVPGTRETSTDGDYLVVKEKHDALDRLQDVVTIGLNDDVIWTGALVNGSEAADLLFVPITLPRAPMTISLGVEGLGSGAVLQGTVEEPNLANWRTKVSELVANLLAEETTVPARVFWNVQEVSDSKRVEIALGGNVKYGGVTVDNQFNWNSTEKHTKMLAKYQRIYYTVDLNTPTRPSALFDPAVTPEDAAEAMPPGSDPMYVATVGYGMLAVLCVETDFTSEEIKDALDAAYQGAFDAEIRFGYTAEKVLQKSNLTILVYGGGSDGVSSYILNGVEGFKQIIQQDATFGPSTPGVPIFYKFRHLHDNALAFVSLTSQYTLEQRVQQRQRIRVKVPLVYCEAADDEGPTDTVDMTPIQAWATPIQAGVAGTEATVFSYTGGEINMDAGSIWYPPDEGLILAFDLGQNGLAEAAIKLRAYARDLDLSGDDETGETSVTLTAADIFGGDGKFTVRVYGNDSEFTLRYDFELTDATIQ